MNSLLAGLSLLILFYFIVLSIGFNFLLLVSLKDIFKQFKESELEVIHRLVKTIPTRPILTILVPVYNEKRRVLNTVSSILNNQYPLNIILINDESTDNTMTILKEEYQLYEVPCIIKQTIKTKPVKHVYKSNRFSNITVIDKAHGYNNGADSLNVGLNACTTPLYMTVDADTVVEDKAISRLLYNFFSKQHCISVGGAVFVLNELPLKNGEVLRVFLPKKNIPAFQAIEYIRSFLFGRTGWNFFNGALCYAGAFTLFEKQAVMEVGGYDSKNFSYDAEIVVKLHDYMLKKNYPYTINFTSNAFSWTVVPPTIKSYWRQRNFWQRGLLKTFMLHKHMFFNFRYGRVGLFNVPFNLFFEVLAPVIEFVSYVLVILALVLKLFVFEPVFWALALAWGYAAFLNLANFYLNVLTYKKYNNFFDSFKVIYLVLLEMLGFRQLRSACCFFATIQFFWNRLRGRYL